MLNTRYIANSIRRTLSAMPRAFSTYERTFLADDLVIKETPNLKPKPGPDHKYTFGGITTDYMLEIDYDRENGGW